MRQVPSISFIKARLTSKTPPGQARFSEEGGEGASSVSSLLAEPTISLSELGLSGTERGASVPCTDL